MIKKIEKQSSNFLTALGRPAFELVILIISLAGFILIFSEKFLNFLHKSKLPTLKFPVFRLPKLKLPTFSFKTSAPVFSKARFFLYALSFIFLGIFIYVEIFLDLPNPSQLSNFPSKLTTQILDRNGVLLYKIYKDENRTLITLDDLPVYVKNAFLAAEDRDFYSHKGFSVTGLLRALYRNLIDDRLEGGSTITQQLIKNTLLTPEKTISRKVKEIVLAVWTEKLFTKDQIFQMYLNQVGFGGPAYGIQEAARQYFDVDAQELDIAQAAFLAGITRAPGKYSPFGEEPKLSLERQRWVLEQMYRYKMLTESEYQTSLSEKLSFKAGKIEIKAPHFVMLVKKILEDQLGENVVTQGGLKVYTTLDSSLQDFTQKTVSEEIKKLRSLHVNNGSALITDPKTGDVLAMVGSKDYFDLEQEGQVNLTLSLRQPGSSIKPLNYALYFENGKNPSELINDHPITLHITGQESWTPKNYDGKFHGSVTLRQALASSYNIPSVLILTQNGIENFASFAKKLGITTWNDPSRFGYSMALGSLEVRMTDLATAYSTFPNLGSTTPLKTILRIESPEGKIINLPSCPEETCVSARTISPSTAYLISDILSDNSARTPAFGANSVLNIKSAKVAVKTGTSNDLKDNWTIGYTQNFLVATWVGNNDNTPMSKIASGITGASPIWAKIFNHILESHKEAKEFTLPDNLVKVSICTITGTLTCAGCPTRTDYYVKGTEPKTTCDPADIAKRLHPILPANALTSQVL